MYQFVAYSENRKTLLIEDNFYAALRIDVLFKANDLPVVVFIIQYTLLCYMFIGLIKIILFFKSKWFEIGSKKNNYKTVYIYFTTISKLIL